MRVLAQWDKARTLYDERFCRMWEFYLAASEVTFRHWGHMVFQAQLTKQIGTLPITRDYMLEEEQRLAGIEKPRSEEHTSELQSLMRISYAVFCLKKKNKQTRKIITSKYKYRKTHTNHYT